MADEYGGFGSGLAEGLQVASALQTERADRAQKEVNLQQSQLQLDATRQLHAFATGKAFQEAISDPNTATQALYDFANQALADGLPDQAKAIYDVISNKQYTEAYSAEQLNLAQARTADELGQAAANVHDPQSWNTFQQWVNAFHPELLRNPAMKQFLSGGYSQQKVSMIPNIAKTVQQQALAKADSARALQADTAARREQFEDERDEAEANEANARADALRKQGAAEGIPTKQETQSVVDRLKADYPMASTEPVDTGNQLTDTTAVRENREAVYNTVASGIASAAKDYAKQGMSWQKALDKAMADAKAHGDLNRLQRRGPNQGGAAQGYTPGQVVNGYRFKGGDATNEANWEPVSGQ